jgi:hypothetical protein
MKKNVLIWTSSVFNIGCGGLNVQYELCRVLKEMGVNVKIYAPIKVENSIFNDYYEDNEFDLNETVVIYGETIDGNPLNAPYVVRWILAPMGIYFTIDKCNTWGKNDLVYYFNSESKIKNNPDKLGNIFKMLPIMYISKYIQNNNIEIRNGICYTIRKGIHMHKELVMKHPPNSFEILNSCGLIECIDIFNKYKYFLSYDPLTFYNIIAAMCGCISIVVKVDGLSKEDWLNTLAPVEYLKETGEPLYGLAYGEEEIEFAKSTLHLVEEQWININKFFKKKYVESFINDINNFESQINTLENNFYK